MALAEIRCEWSDVLARPRVSNDNPLRGLTGPQILFASAEKKHLTQLPPVGSSPTF